MTDDEHKALIETVIAELEPLRDLTARVLTIVEQLMKRIEVLELEAQHQRPSREA